MNKTLHTLVALVLALALTLGLCACQATPGSSSGTSSQSEVSTSSGAEAPAARPTADRSGNAIEVPETIDTIVSLAPAFTQVLCDLGLSDRLVAVDTQSPLYSELPEGVVQFDLMAPDLEQLLALEPDILFVSPLSSQGGDDVFAPLREQGLCVAEIPTAGTLSGVAEDVQFIADCVGLPDEGKALVDGMQETFDAVEAIGQTISERKSVLFEISPLPYLYSFGEGVYLDEMLALIGADNALAGQTGWLAVTEESAIAADPDVILTNVNFTEDPVQEILSRAGWENVTAVKEGAVYLIDNGTSSLPNHHVAEALVEMAKAIYPEAYASLN